MATSAPAAASIPAETMSQAEVSETGGLPADAINIGGDHFIVYAEYQGETAGINEYHRNGAGAVCAGWVPFRGAAWARQFDGVEGYQAWDVVQREPLTLSPSIKCRACGNHGHIEGGMWRNA